MTATTASLQLVNGLRVELFSDPAAGQAAALMQVAAGSYQEPDRWPGLAHLLEHMLFRGSERFRQQQTLMSWLPAQGGRLNATTQATRSAFFFEAPPEHLAGGMARLVDMLRSPLLEQCAIRQETAIIDAEYRLLSRDRATLCAAAVQHAFSGIAQMARFHTGDLHHFGEDSAALQQALRQFHQRYYAGKNMRLWLQGPQPLTELRAIAEAGLALTPGQPALMPPQAALQAQGDRRLQLAGVPQLQLTFALNEGAARRGWLLLLEQLLLDETPGGLLAWLRQREYADSVQLNYQRCGAGRALLGLAFNLIQPGADEAAQLEQGLFSWLASLGELSSTQLMHYQQLALQRFARLAPLEQLRARAFGFPPPDQPLTGFGPWLQQLSGASRSRLYIEDVSAEATLRFQGVALALHNEQRRTEVQGAPPPFRFFPEAGTLPVLGQLPSQAAPLIQLNHAATPTLLLRPTPATPLDDLTGQRLRASLRALAATLAHQGGQLSVEREQGVWLIQLTAGAALLCRGLNAINQQLAQNSARGGRDARRRLHQEQQQEQGAIAVRRLLAQLPRALRAATPENVIWQATLAGGDRLLRPRLARLLSQFPWPLAASVPPALPDRAPLRLVERGEENALLLFYPLAAADDASRLALRLLARLYGPRFYQRLRVELNIGYVAQCQFYRCADTEGMLLVMQSPHCSPEQLQTHCEAFLQQQAQLLPHWPQVEQQQASASLRQALHSQHPHSASYVRDQALTFPPAATLLDALDGPALLACHQRLFSPR